MKKVTFKIFALIALLFSASVVMAAKPVQIGTGGEKGNYYGMVNDLLSDNYCKSTLPDGFDNISTGGSVDNLIGMTNKLYSMGVVQSDVLMNMAKTSPRKINGNFIKVIAGLHNETVHLLVPNDYKPKSSNGIFSKFSFGSKSEPLKLSTLKDQTIASWGGSITSAKAISFFMNLNWKVIAIDSANASNAHTPIVLTGGQPYAPVEELIATGKWTLLAINYQEIATVAPFYIKTEANYKINGNPVSIPTIGVQALLVGKSFRKKDRNTDTEMFASCINDSLADLADDPDTNPNWASVYENNNNGGISVTWPMFDLK